MKNSFVIGIIFVIINFFSICAQWEVANNGLLKNGYYLRYINVFTALGNNVFAGSEDGGIFYTSNNGSNWYAKNNGMVDTISVNSMVINGNNIFAGTDEGIYLSNNNGDSWEIISEPYMIYSLAVNGNYIYGGTLTKILLKSTDNGENWSKFTFNKFTPMMCLLISGKNVIAGTGRGIYISTDDGESWNSDTNGIPVTKTVNGLVKLLNNVYAIVSKNQVYKSTDDGLSWTPVNNNLGDISINQIIVYDNYYLFISTEENGVYISTDKGITWETINYGLDNLKVNTLGINDEYIFAMTGYGVFRAKLEDLGITTVNENYSLNLTSIYPNPASDYLFISGFEGEVEIINALGISLWFGEINSGQIIDVSKLENGIYFLKNKNSIQKFMVLR